MSGVVLAPYLTGRSDPQRRGVSYEPNRYDLVGEWYESLAKNDLFGIIFHTECSERWIEKKFDPARVEFRKVTPRKRSCNDYRFILYEEWIAKHGKHFDYVLMTDLFDVTFDGNPFKFMQEHPNNKLFCGCTGPAPGFKARVYYKTIYKRRLPEDRPYIIGCALGGPMEPMRVLLTAMGRDWPRVPKGLNANQQVINRNAWDLFDPEEVWLNEPFLHDAARGHREKKACITHRHYLKDQ